MTRGTARSIMLVSAAGGSLACAALAQPNAPAPLRGKPPRGTAEAAPTDAADRLRAGAGFLHRGLDDLAVAEYSAFLSHHPDHAEAPSAHYGLGIAWFRLGKFDQAALSLDRALKSQDFEHGDEGTLLRAQCAIVDGDDALAATLLGTFRDRFPRSDRRGEAALLLAESLYRAGKFQESLASAESLGDGEPGITVRAGLVAALSCAALGLDREAADRLSGLLDRSPDGLDRPTAELAEAQCRARLGDWERAAARFTSAAASTNPAVRGPALLGLADAERSRGRAAAALSALDRLDAASGGAPEAQFQRGLILRDLRREREAIAAFERVTKSGHADLADDASYWAAASEASTGDHAGAARRLAASLAAYPDSALRAWMSLDLASALTRTGDLAEATRCLTRLLDAQPDTAVAHAALANRASVWFKLENYEAAGRDADALLDGAADDSRRAPLLLIAAESRFALQDFPRAADRYREYLVADPESPDRSAVHLKLALSLVNADDRPGASVELGTALERYRPDGSSRTSLAALGDAFLQRDAWAEASRCLAPLVDDAAAPADLREDSCLKLAISLQRSGAHRDASAVFARFSHEFPRSRRTAQAVFERGQCEMRLGNSGEAVRCFESVLSLEEDGAEPTYTRHALRHLASLASDGGEAARAADWLDRIAKLPGSSGEDSDLAPDRAAALLSAGKFAECVQVADEWLGAVSDDPRAASVRGHRAIALSRLGKCEESLGELGALSAEPGIDPALRAALAYERARCLVAAGRKDEARQVFAALIDDPKAPTPLTNGARAELATLEVSAGRFEDAMRALGPLDPGSEPRVRYLRGTCELRAGQPGAAAATLAPFGAELAAHADAPYARLTLGEAMLQSGRSDAAIPHLKAVAASAAQIPAVHEAALLRLGEACAASHQWNASEAAFIEHLDRYADSGLAPQAEFGAGWARENDERHQAAIEMYRRVTARGPHHLAPRAQFQIGECLFALGKHEEAVSELLKADMLYAVPEWSAAAVYESGRCFAAMGKADRAAEQFREVISRFAGSEWADRAEQELKGAAERGAPHPQRRAGQPRRSAPIE